MQTTEEQTRWLDATDQAALVSSGQVKPQELVEAAIERIDRLDPILGAVTLRYFDQRARPRTPDRSAPWPASRS